MKPKSSTRRRKKCLAIAKKIVKIRDNFTCQKCKKSVKGVNCQASHVISEGKNKKLSIDPLNMKVLCYQCHKGWRHLEPTESGEWFKKEFPLRWEYLQNEFIESKGSVGTLYYIEKLKELEELYEAMQKEYKK